MTRSTYWSTALAAAALIALPAAGLAQPPASPPSQQPTTQTPASQSTTSPPSDTATSPADHVRAAKQALSSVPQNSIPAKDRAQFAQLRTHLNSLEREVATAAPGASASKPAASNARRGSASATHNWGTDVSAIDTILTKLIGPDTGSNTASETGAAGSSVPSAAGTTGRAGSAASLDEATVDKLRDVRRHMTELAAAMSGTAGGSGATGASPAAASPGAMGSASSSSSSSSASQASPTASPTTSPTAGSPEPSAASPNPTSSETPSSQPPTAAAGMQPATSTPESAQVDAAAAKQHLSEARDSLSQLTTLPEATKLQGEARTQVSQLISNFNELITTQANWREAYAKVDANLNTLLGPDTDAPAAPGTAGTTGSTAATGSMTGTSGSTTPTIASGAGASGSANAAPSGTVQLDPAIRAKLVEFRTHLKAFEQAAGGAGASAAAAGTLAPSAATSSSTNPANPASNPASAQASAASTQSATGAVGTSGSTAAAPMPTDTQGQGAKTSEPTGHAQADKELDAIQAILDKSTNGNLDKADVDQLKAHIAQLRSLLGQGGVSR